MTLDDVRTAARALEATDTPVSANAIVARLGGSKRDVLRFLRIVREEGPDSGRPVALAPMAAVDLDAPATGSTEGCLTVDPGIAYALASSPPTAAPVPPTPYALARLRMSQALADHRRTGAALIEADEARVALDRRIFQCYREAVRSQKRVERAIRPEMRRGYEEAAADALAALAALVGMEQAHRSLSERAPGRGREQGSQDT